MDNVRLIKDDELEQLLFLYKFLIPDDPELNLNEDLQKHWKKILSDPSCFFVVIEEDEKLVSTCNLNIIKNLTRSARSYAIIENVVTNPDYRRKGYGTAVLKKAVEIAQTKNCYKIMLSTSNKDDETFRFYEKAGFNRKEKTAFIMRI
jgi:ribosomal protein S18 acetylase RimI-like enzyme